MEKLINMCKNQVFLHESFTDKYWVYAVYDSSNELIFIYYGTYKEIFTMRPLRLCDGFNNKEIYTYVLLKCYPKKIDAENGVTYWINNSELQGRIPTFNAHLKLYNNDALIQCVENGRYYRTCVDVTKIFNVSGSALSNHLRGVSGYRSVKGLHFKRYYGDRPDEIEEYGGYKLQRAELGGYKRVPSDDPVNTSDPEQKDKALENLRMRGMIW